MKENLQKEAYLQSLKNGTTRVDAAEAAGACTTTVWNWRHRDEEFAKAEQAALESRITVVEDALYKNASSGYGKSNTIAQIFWLKNRNKKHWSDKQEIEINIPKTIKVKSFIQAGEPPVIEEEPEEEGDNGTDTVPGETK